MPEESAEVATTRKKLAKQWAQEEKDKEFAKTFSAAHSSHHDLICRLRLRIGALEQQVKDERSIAYGAVMFVAIACTILGRVL